MLESAAEILTPWSNFYVMAGSAAAALTGLMFVVITLVSGIRRPQRSNDGISAYSTPTVVHFGTVLLVSAILSAPWHSLVPPAVLLGVMGLCGVAYVALVTTHQRKLTLYRPDTEDVAWHSVLPFLSYAAILVSATVLPLVRADAMFTIAGGMTLLIFIGIHNAWDVVTYLAAADEDDEPTKG